MPQRVWVQRAADDRANLLLDEVSDRHRHERLATAADTMTVPRMDEKPAGILEPGRHPFKRPPRLSLAAHPRAIDPPAVLLISDPPRRVAALRLGDAPDRSVNESRAPITQIGAQDAAQPRHNR